MQLPSRLRRWMIDRFIPPIPANAEGVGYFAYVAHKSAVVDGRAACPLMDPLIAARADLPHFHLVIGTVGRPEVHESMNFAPRISWFEFAVSLFCGDGRDGVDRRFIYSLLSDQMCRPKLIYSLYRLRSYYVARYFALKFRGIAQSCESAYVICYYSAVMLGVVRAFRELGKPVWDVQHGHLGETHDAYNNGAAFSLGSRFAPTGFLVWDRSFGEFLEGRLGREWRSTDYLHLRALASPAGNTERSAILYTLQTDTQLPVAVIDAVRNFPNLRWSFRLHPAQLTLPADLSFLHSLPNVRVTDRTVPLPAELSASRLHVTFNSSVVHEAAALGVPSIFLDESLRERFASEGARGLATYSDEAGFRETLETVLRARGE